MFKPSVSYSDENFDPLMMREPSEIVTEYIDELDTTQVSKEHFVQTTRTSGKNFNELPRNVIFMIFNFLDSTVIALCLWPVCKTWYEIGHDTFLWKKITYRSKGIKRNPALFKTDWVVRNCCRLESLTLKNCFLRNASAVRAVVSGCPHLRHLSLSYMVDSSLNEFAELKTLVSLELSFVQKLAVDFLPRLSKNSNQLQRVILKYSAFHFRDTIFADVNVLPLLTNLKAGLKSLHLTANYFGSGTYQAIAQCTNLRSISLYNPAEMNDEDLQVMEMLQNLSDLTLRSVRGVTSDAWLRFIKNVPSNHINSLNFDKCGTLDLVMEEVLSSRKDTIFHKAKSIHLINFTHLTDRAISMILEGNSDLHTLALFNCEGFTGEAFNISDASIAPALRYLEIKPLHHVPCRYLKTFQTNRPHLSVCNGF